MIFGNDFTILIGLGIWLAVLAGLLVAYRGRTLMGTGLVLAYLMALALIHVPGAMIYLDPGYRYYDPEMIRMGFEQSTYLVLAFGVSAVMTIWLWQRAHTAATPEHQPVSSSVLLDPRIHRLLTAVGAMSYFVLTPQLQNIPTAGALASVFNQLILVGICLGLWHNWCKRAWVSLVLWVILLGFLPIITTLEQGFIGFGAVAFLTGLAFLFSFVRPRWLVPIIGAVFLFASISVFVTYFRDRTQIRQVVWGGESYEERIGQLAATFLDFEWYNPNNSRHLNAIDQRLNQNRLVGAAAHNIEFGKTSLRYGETFVDALVAWIPRAIWPDKPVQAGSGNLVASITGIKFAAGTSIGVGQVLEFYMNYGTEGVLVGGIIWGILLALLDVNAARALEHGNLSRFLVYYLVGLSFLQPGGSLVEVVATTAAAVGVAFFLNHVLLPFVFGKSETHHDAEAFVSAPPPLHRP